MHCDRVAPLEYQGREKRSQEGKGGFFAGEHSRNIENVVPRANFILINFIRRQIKVLLIGLNKFTYKG